MQGIGCYQDIGLDGIKQMIVMRKERLLFRYERILVTDSLYYLGYLPVCLPVFYGYILQRLSDQWQI